MARRARTLSRAIRPAVLAPVPNSLVYSLSSWYTCASTLASAPHSSSARAAPMRLFHAAVASGCQPCCRVRWQEFSCAGFALPKACAGDDLENSGWVF